MMAASELESSTFRSWDLASLQEQIDNFVDGLLARGVMSWKCDFFGTYHAADDTGPRRVEWVCTVTEGIFKAREV